LARAVTIQSLILASNAMLVLLSTEFLLHAARTCVNSKQVTICVDLRMELATPLISVLEQAVLVPLTVS
jgi:hypothetical protein